MLAWIAVAAFLLVGAAPASADTLCVKEGGGDGCYATIQDAIDDAGEGDLIDVYPGDYDETATGRTVLEDTALENGPHQFGLFIGLGKDGVTIRGVDETGKPICRARDVQAFITTNATNNFGYSGIFVEADGVTLQGLDIGPNSPWSNKTIEVIGDAFTLRACDISDLYGSVYLNDWRFDEDEDVSHVQSYRIEDNNFQDGVSIDLASGAGYSGDVKSRVIQKNTFENQWYWPSISFNGSDTGVPWFVYSVGGAIIRDNTFANTFTWATGDLDVYLLTEGHIRARGTYDNSQFNWWGYLQENKYDQAYLTGPKPQSEDVRTYEYEGYYGTLKNVRRIGALLEGEEEIAETGDKIVARSK
jgi:hypothetical protein